MSGAVRHSLFAAARALGLFGLVRRRHHEELLVLTYHSVVEEAAAAREAFPLVYRNAVSADLFEAQMRFLDAHYNILDAAALRRALASGDVPRRAAVVTFDDGLVNNATVARPRLDRLGVPAVFFLPTAFITAASAGEQRVHWTEDLIARCSTTTDGARQTAVAECLPDLAAAHEGEPPPSAWAVVDHLKGLARSVRQVRTDALRARLPSLDPSQFPADRDGHSILHSMTWDQAREAARSGIALGSHTVNHAILSRLAPATAAMEIRESKRQIEAETDQEADLFAYPIGRSQDFEARHVDMLDEAGYRGAFTQIPGFNRPSTHPFVLRRVGVSGVPSLPAFQYLESGTKMLVDRLLRPERFSLPEGLQDGS
jgi:peptidoglycan/xylan/chitin deacetylase (PgdA/CDA1 family)